MNLSNWDCASAIKTVFILRLLMHLCVMWRGCVCLSVTCICVNVLLYWTILLLHCKVTIDLELHLSKKTEFKSSGRPLAKYDVYLYRVPKAKPRVLNGPSTKTANGPSRTRARVIRWEDDLYPPSPCCSVCSPVSTCSLPASVFKELQQTKPLTIYKLWQMN